MRLLSLNNFATLRSPLSPLVLLMLAVVSLSSCSSVVCHQIVGSTPAKLEAKAWNGTWMTPDKHVLHLRVKEADKGVIEAAWIEEKNDQFVMETHELLIRQHGDWLWANLKDEDHGDFLFGRITEPDDERLLSWSAHAPGFAEAVRSGKLQGEVVKNAQGKESGHVKLAALSDANLESIQRGDIKEAFLWDRPLVLMKLTSEK